MSTRIPGPLFAKLLPRRKNETPQRLSDELLLRKMLDRSEISVNKACFGTPCREWKRSSRSGYGLLWDGQRRRGVHALAYEILVGTVPVGHHVLHHCDNPACWEPTHLWTGTAADNMRDKMNKGRGGHEKLRGRKRPGTGQQGTRHPRSKLTEAKVRRIKMLAAADPLSLPWALRAGVNPVRLNMSALARELEVSESLVRGVIHGNNWSWLK